MNTIFLMKFAALLKESRCYIKPGKIPVILTDTALLEII